MDKRQIIIIIAIIFFTGLTIYRIVSPEVNTPIVNQVPVVEKQEEGTKEEPVHINGQFQKNGLLIQFKYPENWIIVDLPDPKARIVLKSPDYESVKSGQVDFAGDIYINTISNPNNLSIEELFSTFDDTSKFWIDKYKYEKIATPYKYSGIKFLKFQEEGSSYHQTRLYFKCQNNIISLSYLYTDNKYQDILENIALSLKCQITTVSFSDTLSATIEVEDNYERIILKNNEEEIVIEEIEKDKMCCTLKTPKFSDDGKYLYYNKWGYEVVYKQIYSLEKDKIVLELDTPTIMKFLPESNIFYVCSDNDFGGKYAQIYSTPNFEPLFDLDMKQFESHYSIYCHETSSYTPMIRFRLKYTQEEKIEFFDYIIETGEVFRTELDESKPFGSYNEAQLPIADIDIKTTEDFYLVTSVLSNKGDKVVYAEMNSGNNSEKSVWDRYQYNIFIKDLNSGEKNKIYSFPEDRSKYSFLNSLFIKKARAGGSPLFYIPIAWTPNDEKIILTWIFPGYTGSAGPKTHPLATVNTSTYQIEPFGYGNEIFIENYHKVITTKPTENSLTVCGMVSMNRGALIIKNLESNEEQILLNEDNSYYSPQYLDKNNILTYYRYETVKINDQCAEQKNGVKQTIKIK